MPSRAWLQTAMTTVGLTGALALIGYVAGASFELRLGLPNEKAIFSLEPCLREGAAFLFSSFSLAAFMAFEHPAPIVLALLVVGCAAWSARFLSEPARRRCTRILAFLALIAAGGKLLVLDFPLTAVENLLRRPLAFPPSMETGRLHGLAIHRLALSAFEAEYFSRLDKDLRPAVENFVATNSRVDKRDFVRRARVLYAVNATLTLALVVLSFVLARSKTLEDSGNEPSIPARSWSGLPKLLSVLTILGLLFLPFSWSRSIRPTVFDKVLVWTNSSPADSRPGFLLRATSDAVLLLTADGSRFEEVPRRNIFLVTYDSSQDVLAVRFRAVAQRRLNRPPSPIGDRP